MKLWQKILIGLGLGLIAGLVLGPKAEIFKPLGDLFINAIKMLIVPLIFSSLYVGVTSIQDPAKMGRIGLKTVGIYLFTTAFAICIGLLIGNLMPAGHGLELSLPENFSPSNAGESAPSFITTLIDIVPTNPIASLSNGTVLQIIVFALLFGIATTLIGEKGKKVVEFFDSVAEIMYKLTAMVMELAPYGVFGLMAWVTGAFGLDVLKPLLMVVVGLYLGALIHMALTMGGAIFLFGRLNPFQFFKKITDAQAVAFTTTSSSGTLPVTLKTTQEKMGISKSISSFVLPLGATINMDGTALYQGVTVLFVANAYGVTLGFPQYITIILTSTLASIGTAGVPGAGLIMLSLVLTSVGLPIEGIAIVAGIDRILDMARTTVNVTGDAMTALLVAKTEGELDEQVFNS
jgi:Na+/H+-dicarboxylate symporter